MMDVDDDDEGEDAAEASCSVQCFLNVTPIAYARDGFVCVAVANCSQAKNAAPMVQDMYVHPQDLRLPRNAQEWEDALSHIVV